MPEADSVGPRRIVRVQDLADDPVVFVAYDEAHRPGRTPAAVLDAQRRHGILDLEIFRHANRLVMIMTVSLGVFFVGIDSVFDAIVRTLLKLAQ